jgi:hypothetical protein
MRARQRQSTRWRILAVVALASSAGCVGELGGGAAGPTGTDRTEVDVLEGGPGGMRALTVSQYTASVRDIFGLPPDATLPRPGNWTSSAGASTGTAGSAADYEDAAYEVVAMAFADPVARERVLGGCTPSSSPGDACTRGAIERVGRRAYRRRLGVEEMQRWTELATTLARDLESAELGLQYVLAGILQSPSFLYRLELAEPYGGDDGSSGYYGSDALATRLAYFLWDTTPDDELLAAAERGDLLDPAGYDAQVERMLADARVEAGIDAFVYDMFGVARLDRDCDGGGCMANPETAHLVPAYAPQLVATASAAASAGGFREMLLTRSPFVDGETAEIYGLDPADFGPELVQVELPVTTDRIGVLLTPGHLALNASREHPSVVRRGLFVIRTLLCESIAGPPAEALIDPPVFDPAVPQTARELAVIHARPECSGCHGVIDPIGLAFENYDAEGWFRELDHGLPIDPSGELYGEAFADASELIELIADHPAFLPCMTTHVYERATGLPASRSAAEIAAITSASRGDVRATMRAVARMGAFRRTWGEMQ